MCKFLVKHNIIILLCVQWHFRAWSNKIYHNIKTCGKRFSFHKQFNILIMQYTLFYKPIILYILYCMVFSPEQHTPEGSRRRKRSDFLLKKNLTRYIIMYLGTAEYNIQCIDNIIWYRYLFV